MHHPSSSIELSLVLPIYNESESIQELYTRSCTVLKQYGEYEIIFVNDASTDNSLEKLTQIAAENQKVKIINFSRNFGHQIAITAGLDYASGKAVVVMDSDLQDPPEVIAQMVAKWKEGYHIVYGKRHSRKDTAFKKITAFGFYRLLKKFANINIPEDTGDFRLMDKKAVDALRRMPEQARFMRGMAAWIGFKQTFVLFDRDERKHGQTNYPLRKMLRLSMDGLTSFSYIPLRLASYIGFLSACVGFIWGVYAVYRRFFLPASETVPGWTTLVIAVFFMGGIQLIILGIMGEYIGRTYTEAQHRPLYIVSDTVNISHEHHS